MCASDPLIEILQRNSNVRICVEINSSSAGFLSSFVVVMEGRRQRLEQLS
jgi:hypothetical protein